MDQFIQSVIAFVESNKSWAPWILMLLAAAETTVLVSVIVPSTAIMVGIGALAATGALSFTPLWIGASVGAILGSFGSYWLGWRYGDRILAMKPLSTHPEWAEKAQAAFDRWGAATVLVGHFVAFMRPVVFLMAGMSRMNIARFTLWNVLGCLAWAWVVPKSGELGGHVLGWLWGHFH